VPSDTDLLFGQIALSKGFCTQKQIDACVGVQSARKDGRPLGRILLDEGHITEEQHSAVLAFQRENLKAVDPLVKMRKEAVLFGKLAVREGLITEREANECLRDQAAQGESRSLGEIMVSKGCLTTEQVKDLLAKQQKKIMNCPVCRLSFTVLSISKDKRVECPRCKGPLAAGKPTDSTRTDAQFATQVLRATKGELPSGAVTDSRIIPPNAVKLKVTCIICDTPFLGPVDSTGRVRCPSCQTLFVPAKGRKRE
jgi:hypothetical protein